MTNLAMTAGPLDAGGVWDLEDDEALAAAKTFLGQYSEIDLDVAAWLAEPDKSSPATSTPPDLVAGKTRR